MTDMPLPRTTIGQLVYPEPPRLNFARLVSDLHAALSGCGVQDRALAWDHDDVAIIDVGGSRVALSLAEDLGRCKGAAITVTTGFGLDDRGGDTRLAQRQAVLARLIAGRIAERFPPAETIWTDSPEIATSDLFDRLNDALAQRLDAEESERTRRKTRERSNRARRLREPADVEPILARLERRLASRAAADQARREGREPPSPEADAGAGGETAPPPLRSGWLEAAEVRETLAALRADNRPSAPLRLAGHMMDATLMVVALPVGAAMMTYGLVRGGDVYRSGRMLALCGIGMVALEGLGGPGIVSTLLPSL
ncbi:hypothetical protein [Rubellimicrobium sp. CFH 75288]|uniref:hypothetical protein n=1 Tax=Rubellimicrobium sp. CFH 75288 TaxID=2697034 RepID=UPI00141292CB|nr:hypothetical protein [Rubellimicrobium sp. CFH 75288]NAZ35549.1 hypothetical protein [Rubellimicrobium sp. CFH 75288]